MSDEIRWATRPYDGYSINQPSTPDLDMLQVGPGTPGGSYFRRFWLPIAMSSQLKELPVAIRLLGEELVVFRDLAGWFDLQRAGLHPFGYAPQLDG